MSERYDFSKPIRLLGGFNCEINNAENNRWTEYVTTHPKWLRLNQIGTDLTYLGSAIKGGDLSPETKAKFDSLFAESDAIHIEFYQIGKSWFEELTKSEKRESVEA